MPYFEHCPSLISNKIVLDRKIYFPYLILYKKNDRRNKIISTTLTELNKVDDTIQYIGVRELIIVCLLVTINIGSPRSHNTYGKLSRYFLF